MKKANTEIREKRKIIADDKVMKRTVNKLILYPLISVDIGDVLPVKSVHAVRDHERRHPLLSVTSTLCQYSSHLHIRYRQLSAVHHHHIIHSFLNS